MSKYLLPIFLLSVLALSPASAQTRDQEPNRRDGVSDIPEQVQGFIQSFVPTPQKERADKRIRMHQEDRVSPRESAVRPASTTPAFQHMEEVRERIRVHIQSTTTQAVRTEILERARAHQKEMRERFEEHRAELADRAKKRITDYNGRLLERLTAALERMEKLAERLASRLEKLSERGVDTSKAEGYLAEAEEAIALAYSLIEDARKHLDEVLESDTPREAFVLAREIVAEITASIREAHSALVQAIRAAKAAADLRIDIDNDNSSGDDTNTDEKDSKQEEEDTANTDGQ